VGGAGVGEAAVGGIGGALGSSVAAVEAAGWSGRLFNGRA
jgi:hypothetical protein